MRLEKLNSEAMQIDFDRYEDDEKEQAELGYSFFWLVCAFFCVLFILRSESKVLASIVLALPIAFCLFLAFSRLLSSHLLVIDRKNNRVCVKDRWLARWKVKDRRFEEFSAVMLIEDRVDIPPRRNLPRFRLFFCLGPKTPLRRVLLLDEVESAQEAARVAKEIGQYTDWPIEFLTLDRTIENSDVDWESW